MSDQMGVSRRSVLKRLGASAGAFAVWPYVSESTAEAYADIQAAGRLPAPVFLSAAQYATTDAIAETIIPADDRSPGARGARVADYIDLLLSESSPETQQRWTAGLAALDERSRQRAGQPFTSLSARQALDLLTELSVREEAPTTALEQFFKDAKEATIRGYYTSEPGIHEELKYQGNKFLTEFVGCTHPEHGA